MSTTTPRRSSRTHVERIAIINDSAEDLSELESVVDDDDRISDSSSDDEGAVTNRKDSIRTPKKRAKTSVTPVTRRTESARKKTPLRKGSRYNLVGEPITPAALLVNDESCKDQIRIIDVVFDLTKKKSDIKQCIDDWNRLYGEDSNNAIASVMSFVLHLCGCSLSFPTAKINDDLNEPSFIKHFQASIEEANSTSGLLSPNKTASKRFESRLKTWASVWIEHMPQSVLFDSDIISRIIEWATTLSQNSLRTIRLVACTFIFSVLSALIPYRHKIQGQLASIEKSLQQKSKRPAKAVVQMSEDKVEFQSNLDTIDQHVSAIFQEIFVPRYRDIYAVVRERCIESLRDWILSFDSFASDAYFKYLGWALNSSHSTVRILAIRAIDTLVKSDSVRPKMTSFLNRFIQRIIEMHHDVDEPVGACAIETCTTILVHDDILTNFESFGDVAPLLWDKSRLVREAAANYVFEDSFNPESLESPSKASLQADIEQLYTIFTEAAPKNGSFSFLVSTLVDLFFFKLSCMREREALLDALKCSADARSSSNSKSEYSLSHFIAQLMLGCCNHVTLNQESHSRLSKTQRSTVSAVSESYLKFISDPEFLSVLQQFQAEREVFTCLVKLISAVAKNQNNQDISSNFEVCPRVGDILVAALKRETNRDYLHPIAVALAILSTYDSELERDTQHAVSEYVHSVETFEVAEYMFEQPSLLALAALSRMCCISQQIYCPILQESEFLDERLVDLLRSISDSTEITDVLTGIIESFAKISHSVVLWGLSRHLDIDALQRKVSRLLDITKTLLSSKSERLCVLAASITADVSVVALNNPQIRFCLSDDIFHLLREFISHHSTCLETIKAGARLVCAFCPERVSICATLIAISADCNFEERFQQIVKVVVAYLRSRDSRTLALAILEALLMVFRDKGIKEASSLSRRMAVSYGVTRTSASHFDVIVIGGFDRLLDEDIDMSFLSVLHPFVQRSSPSMLKTIAEHIQSVRLKLRDESLLPMVEELYQLVTKKLPTESATSVKAQDNDDEDLESIHGTADGEQGDDAALHDDAVSRHSGL